jgi:hypothetical protein
MRGYLSLLQRRRQKQGSIPADAGLPVADGVGVPALRVYPRGCGATPAHAKAEMEEDGLSPRMRGYLANLVDRRDAARSIPADAGLPKIVENDRHACQVYPRGCGATDEKGRRKLLETGLSPRMRGYQNHPAKVPRQERSIPADAGLPSAGARSGSRQSVYPRGCGATGCRTFPVLVR